MAATYSTRINLTKQGDGDNSTTWGTVLNDQVIELLDEALMGHISIDAASADVTITETNGTSDQQRQAVHVFTGTLAANRTITFPAVEGRYLIYNNTTHSGFTFSVTVSGSGSPLTMQQGEIAWFYSDGTDMLRGPSGNIVRDASPELGGNLDVSSYSLVDTNGNELVKFSATASAVNELTVTNNATGSAPSLSATGGDTNIDLELTPKGSGNVTINTDIARTAGYRKLWFPCPLIVTGSTLAPTRSVVEFGTLISNLQAYEVLTFPQSTTTILCGYITLQPGNSYNGGDIKLSFKWYGTGTGTGTCTWGARAEFIAEAGDVNLGTWGSSSNTADSKADAGTSTFRSTSELTITPAGSWANDSMMLIQLFRNGGSDTYTGDANLLGVHIRLPLVGADDD